MNKLVKVPVVLFIYKKENTLIEILKRINAYNPSRFYVVSDIWENENDNKSINKTRKIVNDYTDSDIINWIIPPSHQGIINIFDYALDIIFEKEDQAIILEDDTIPSNAFFHFCALMLEKYKTDYGIGSIIGTNLGSSRQSNTYFKTLVGLPYWGWATWADRWKHMPKDFSFWDSYVQSNAFKELLNTNYPYSHSFLRNRQNPKSWDLKWAMFQLSSNMKSIVPGINLITNNGYNELATFTKIENSTFANIQLVDSNIECNNFELEDKLLALKYEITQKKFISEFAK
jgi:hypothetical protein